MAAKYMHKHIVMIILIMFVSFGCQQGQWNNPYRDADTDKAIIYSAFQERPKELDPVKSYSASEYQFISQIYEPPLQYHYLKRPYQLIPLTATQMPIKVYFDEQENELPADAQPEDIAFTDYIVEIQQGIHYQPHPALARRESNDYFYHQLNKDDLEEIFVLSDFDQQGSRELTAHDYVYQIKRLAHPNLHSPLAGLLGNYIVGFKEYRDKVLTALEDQSS